MLSIVICNCSPSKDTYTELFSHTGNISEEIFLTSPRESSNDIFQKRLEGFEKIFQ